MRRFAQAADGGDPCGMDAFRNAGFVIAGAGDRAGVDLAECVQCQPPTVGRRPLWRPVPATPKVVAGGSLEHQHEPLRTPLGIAALENLDDGFRAQYDELPQGAVLRTKALLKHPDEVLGRINLEAEAFVMRAKSSAAQEAFAAFVEKRKPNFAGLD